jgi:hypothetical protein
MVNVDLFEIVLLSPNNLLLPDASAFDISINEWFDYPALTNYYGPNSIIEVIKFNNLVRGALKTNRKVRVIVDRQNPKRTNAAFLVGAYLVHSKTPSSYLNDCSCLKRE